MPDARSVSDAQRLLRRYPRSRFLSYVTADTLASALATVPLHHSCLPCEDPVVHVVAVQPPRGTRLEASR